MEHADHLDKKHSIPEQTLDIENKKDTGQESVVRLQRVCKRFDIGFKKHENALFRVMRIFSGREQKKTIHVLEEISFDVLRGERVGIIGRNGSGKSTLLRLIAGIYGHDSGLMDITGSVVYISGFSQGLKSKLTMRDNVYLVGSIMGLSKKEIDEEFDSIVDFSGLEDFVETKVYQFSSGMTTRLAFSIFIFCILRNRPDILLLDEVIGAGGDIDFTAKANNKMEELIHSGSTVLFVSHGMGEVEKLCSKVIWIEKGKIVLYGPAHRVIDAYKNSAH